MKVFVVVAVLMLSAYAIILARQGIKWWNRNQDSRR